MGDRFELPAGGGLPMPWKATCHMDERTQFIARVLAGEDEMTVLCGEYGVSRKTGYKWLRRDIAEGAGRLGGPPHRAGADGPGARPADVQGGPGVRPRWPPG